MLQPKDHYRINETYPELWVVYAHRKGKRHQTRFEFVVFSKHGYMQRNDSNTTTEPTKQEFAIMRRYLIKNKVFSEPEYFSVLRKCFPDRDTPIHIIATEMKHKGVLDDYISV